MKERSEGEKGESEVGNGGEGARRLRGESGEEMARGRWPMFGFNFFFFGVCMCTCAHVHICWLVFPVMLTLVILV